MKVGQVTLYHYNYGSALQCYATQQIVRVLGYDCILFHQITESKRGILVGRVSFFMQAGLMALRYPGYTKKFYGLLQASRRSALTALSPEDLHELQRFASDELHTLALSYKEMVREARKPEYLLFLSGSDQVWNGDWFIRNPIYFLRFAPAKKRVAWAPSFGTETVASYNRKRFRKYIGSYWRLSARETDGIRLIQELTGRTAQLVLDPVLLWSADKWRNAYRARGYEIAGGNCVFAYFLNQPSTEALEVLRTYLRRKIKVIAFASRYNTLASLEGVQFAEGSPWLWVAALDAASCVCSDSFHALAFSLLFHKQFLIFQRQYTHASDQSSRVRSLLDLCGLRDRFATPKVMCDIDDKIDFGSADAFLEKERAESLKYLQNAIMHAQVQREQVII